MKILLKGWNVFFMWCGRTTLPCGCVQPLVGVEVSGNWSSKDTVRGAFVLTYQKKYQRNWSLDDDWWNRWEWEWWWRGKRLFTTKPILLIWFPTPTPTTTSYSYYHFLLLLLLLLPTPTTTSYSYSYFLLLLLLLLPTPIPTTTSYCYVMFLAFGGRHNAFFITLTMHTV